MSDVMLVLLSVLLGATYTSCATAMYRVCERHAEPLDVWHWFAAAAWPLTIWIAGTNVALNRLEARKAAPKLPAAKVVSR